MQMTAFRIAPDKMLGRSGAVAERPICVAGLGVLMGDVFQPLEMLSPWCSGQNKMAKH